MKYEIKKGVPVPEQANPALKYPFPDMALGDMFEVPVPPAKLPGDVQRMILVSAGRFRRKYNPDFRIRTQALSDVVKVWRIK